MSTSKELTLDGIEPLKVDRQAYFNEVGSLRTLFNGLRELCASVKRREAAFEKAGGGKFKVMMFGGTSPEEQQSLDVTACMFHWFGLSLCNYARLVGFIRGLHRSEFVRSDLTDKKAAEKAKQSIEAYVASIPELAQVKVWRNKVFAHFAITDPFKDDNISTLDMSVIFPVTFEGRYYVGSMVMTRKNSSGTHTSNLPRWSMTEVFESLIPRFWPGITFQETTEPVSESPQSEQLEETTDA